MPPKKGTNIESSYPRVEWRDPKQKYVLSHFQEQPPVLPVKLTKPYRKEILGRLTYVKPRKILQQAGEILPKKGAETIS
jgi:hypothetical protein